MAYFTVPRMLPSAPATVIPIFSNSSCIDALLLPPEGTSPTFHRRPSNPISRAKSFEVTSTAVVLHFATVRYKARSCSRTLLYRHSGD